MKKFLAVVIASALWAGPFAQSVSANGRVMQAPTTGKAIAIPALGLSAGSASMAPLSGEHTAAGLSSALPSIHNAPIAAQALSSQLNRQQPSSLAVPFNSIRGASGQGTKSRALGNGITIRTPVEAEIFSAAEQRQGPSAIGATAKSLESVRQSVPSLRSGRIGHAAAGREGSELFDGSTARDNGTSLPEETAEASPEKASRRARFSAWGKGVLLKLKPAKRIRVKTALDDDSYGGPPAIKAKVLPADAGKVRRWTSGLTRQVLFGLRQGFNMLGIAALLDFFVKPALQAIPWQLFVSDGFLTGTGRIELLTGMGPSAIAQSVMGSPLSFLFKDLVQAVFLEEIVYRMLHFGAAFLILAAIRPLAKRANGILDEIPELFGLRAIAKTVVGLASRLSDKAFLLAAGYSALIFGAAHFASWGFNPYTFAFHAMMGLVLAHTAYRSRGILAPFMAHFVFNAALISVSVLLPMFAVPTAAAAVSALLSLFSVAFLWYNIRAGRKDQAAARAEAFEKLGIEQPRPGRWRRILTLGMILPAVAAMLISGPNASLIKPVAHSPLAAPGIVMVADTAAAPEAKAPAVAAATVKAAPLSAQELVAKSKAAVVMVRTGGGMGTGFIISPDGLLVTNAHVVSAGTHAGPGGPTIAKTHAETVMIRFANGREIPARVVGFNPEKDLALVQLPMNPFGWPSVPLGDSGALSEGQEIVAMGYPLGLPFSVSRGIVSGLGFRSNGAVNYIQHDASVNPGNSGGPLFNTAGEVVGVNSMIMTQGGGFDGISYSISAADLKAALAQYQKIGNISKGWLGAILYPGDSSSPFGARVDAVRPDSPAAKAGLQAGDIIIGIDGMVLPSDPLQTTGALMQVLKSKIPTDTVEIQVSRDGGVVGLKIILDQQ